MPTLPQIRGRRSSGLLATCALIAVSALAGTAQAAQGDFQFIESRLNGFVMDIEGANTAPAAHVISYPKKAEGVDNQLWRMTPAPQRGWFFIESKLNGFVLDIDGANPAPATGIIAYPKKASGSDNQLWRRARGSAPGFFFIESKLNGFVLDIDGGSAEPLARIIAYPKKASGSDNQLWRLTDAPATPAPRPVTVAAPQTVTKEAREAGPIWNQGDAQKKCPRVCRAPARWTGQWWTTVQGKMSVCECESNAAVGQPVPPVAPGPVVEPKPAPAPAPTPTSPAVTKEAREAGPIWNQGDAQGKCPKVCTAPSKWNGQWWTTIQGKMSVCECETPVPVKQAVEAGPIWNQGDAQAKCPKVCAAPARWTGQWWTTVQGKMSVCECEQ